MFQNQLMFYETINFLVRSQFCNLECRSWIIIRYRREYRNTIRRYRTGAQLHSAKRGLGRCSCAEHVQPSTQKRTYHCGSFSLKSQEVGQSFNLRTIGSPFSFLGRSFTLEKPSKKSLREIRWISRVDVLITSSLSVPVNTSYVS